MPETWSPTTAMAAATTVGAVVLAAAVLKTRFSAEPAKEKEAEPAFAVVVDKTDVVRTPNGQQQRWVLSEVDEMTAVTWIQFGLRVESLLDPAKIRTALQRVLAKFPFVAARLDTTSDPKRYNLVLDDKESNGVIFETAHGVRHEADAKLPDVDSPSTAWSKAGLFFPGKGATPGPDDPLFTTRLIRFEDEEVSFLSIQLNHCLGDAQAYVQLMQEWSKACSSDVDPASLKPMDLPPRVVAPVDETPATRAELLEKWRKEIGGAPPLATRWYWFKLMANFIWASKTCETVEVCIDKSGLEALKQTICDSLPEGEWVSSYETAMSAVLCAQHAASAGVHSKDTRPIVQSFNVRGKLARYPENYVGNAVFDVPLKVTMDPSSLASSAQSLHRAIRAELAQDGENLARRKNWLEHTRLLDMRKETRVFHIIGDCVAGRQTFTNTWAGYNWLVDMGAPAGKGASAYMVPPPVSAPGLNILMPRAPNGDLAIYVVLPSSKIQAFWDYVASAKLPFRKPRDEM